MSKMLKSRQRRIGERGEEGGRKKKLLIIPESSQRLRERDDAGGEEGEEEHERESRRKSVWGVSGNQQAMCDRLSVYQDSLSRVLV
jgi:hypothetical protein